VNVISTYLRSILIGMQLIFKVNLVDIFSRFAYLIFLIVLYCISYFKIIVITPVLIVAGNIGLSSALIIAFGVISYPFFDHLKGSLHQITEIMKYSIPCYLGNLVQFLNYRLDIFIVSFFIGTTGVGLYLLAVTIAQLVWLLSTAFSTALFPSIATSTNNDPENAKRSARITRLVLLTSFISAIGIVCLSPFIPILFGEKFRGSILPLLWILPGIVMFSIVNILASFFAGIGKPKINFYVSFIGVIFTITLDFLLIPRWGIVGASITSSISYSFSALLTLAIFIKTTTIPLHEILIANSEDIRIVLRSIQERGKGEQVDRFNIV